MRGKDAASELDSSCPYLVLISVTAGSMAPAPLNPEPSRPEDREEHHLPPKTYKDAAQENLGSGTDKENSNPSHYVGQGEDTTIRSPSRKPSHMKNGSIRINGLKYKKSDTHLLVEDFEGKDGHRLTSTEPYDFEKALELDESEKPVRRRKEDKELVSGRKAGAGWERSGFVQSLSDCTSNEP